MKSTERAAYLGALIARNSDEPVHVVARHVDALRRAAKRLHGLAIKESNDGGSPGRDKMAERIQRSCRIALQNALGDKRRGAALSFGGDPRGASVVYLKIEGVEGDGFDRERGFAIY